MNRKAFFQKLGLTVIAAVVAPSSIKAITEVTKVKEDQIWMGKGCPLTNWWTESPNQTDYGRYFKDWGSEPSDNNKFNSLYSADLKPKVWNSLQKNYGKYLNT